MSTPSSELTAETLTRHDEIAPGVFLIGYLRRHAFLPGQAIKIALDLAEPPRIYSVCSGTHDEEVWILFNIKAGGLLTPRLAALSVGDRIYASAPYGTFVGSFEPAWTIATGTGIAPFYSMLRSGMGGGNVLVHGARLLNQFYFAEEWIARLGTNYHRCCSRQSGEGIYSGRVTRFLSEQPELPTHRRYYICGQAAMAVEARDILISRGIPFDNIFTEIYF